MVLLFSLTENEFGNALNYSFPSPARKNTPAITSLNISGFLAILEYLLANNLDGMPAKIHGDSKLVIEQMQDNWRMRKGFYLHVAKKARETLKRFRKQPRLDPYRAI